MIRISKLAESVKPSATLAAGAKAKALKATGVSVFDFSLGEPDYDTPKHICDAGLEAMTKGMTHYTAASGTIELKTAIAKWYGRTYGLECKAENVIVSNGAKHSLHNALAATVGPGDDVIIPTPYWVSYSDLVSMTGANPILVPTTLETGFKLTPEQLRAAITPKTRCLMLNSPCNPTGTVYTKAELEALADVFLEQSDGYVLSDEIYEQLCFGTAKPTCFATLRPQLKDRTITVSGASKSYAMTGWRLGWAVAPAAVVKAMDTIQSQETSCPSSIAQHAMITALESPLSGPAVEEMRKEFEARRDLVTNLLRAIPGLKFAPSDGAFYAFFNVSSYFGKTFGGKLVTNDVEFCNALLEQAHVNLVMGSAFGAEGFVRMSFACSRANIEGGLAKLAEWLKTGK
jgi:aspartate aminotransferase